MNIHKSHTKRDLIHIFLSVKVYIEPDSTKREIIEDIQEYIACVEYSKTIPNLTALKTLLMNPSTKSRLTIEEKSRIMILAKKIIQYCMNQYILGDLYKTHEEVYSDAMKIYNYGDIPTIRRALKLYNKSPHRRGHVNPKISIEMQQLISDRELVKNNRIIKYKYNQGKFLVKFPD